MKLKSKLNHLFTIIILFFSTICTAQLPINLVNNYSFEEPAGSSTPRNSCERSFVYHRPAYWNTYDYSYNVSSGCGICTPDYQSFSQDHLNFCNLCTDKDRNPFQDDRFIRIVYEAPLKEFILTELNQTLQIGKKYKFRVQAWGTANEWFSAHLSKKGGNQWPFSQNENLMHFMVGNIPNTPVLGACKVKAYETIVNVNKSDLNYLIIEAQGQISSIPNFFIDKVELYEYCTELLIRSNREYWYESELEEANNIIAGATVNVALPGDILMIDGSLTTYKAEKEVKLVSGFNVDRGADFTAKIGQCGSDCPTTNTDIDENHYLCANECIKVGAFSIRGLTYEWTSANPTFLDLLSSTNISSPIFCPGNSGVGTYKYIVKIRNNCGEITEKTVYVHYYPSSNPNPDFTIINNNLNLSPIYPSIEIDPDINTEKIYVDVLNCDGNLILSQLYNSGIDFSNTENIQWSLNTYLSPCNCYKIRIRAKNYCYETIKEVILDWNRVKQPTNVDLPTFSFCKDGKRWICISGDGIDKGEFTFFNNWGLPVSTSNQTITSDPFCFPIPDGNELPDGTYYLTVKLWGCNGTEVVYDRITVFLPSCTNFTANSDTLNNTEMRINELSKLDSLQLTISPNPLQSVNQINYHVPTNGHIKIKVLNSNFESIKTIIDSDHINGDYVTQFTSDNLIFGINYILLELYTNDSYQKIVSKVILQQN